jgi:PD-(D/E)XK nuclease superfamily protein
MKLPILSHTLLNTWTICAHQCYRRYIAKDLPKEVKSEAQQAGIDGHRAVEARVRHKTPLPAPMAHWEPLVAPLDGLHVEPEQKLAVVESGRPVDFWDGEAWLRGALDAPVLLSTDTAVLADWKTGKQREDPFELEIGAVLLQAKRPEIRKLYGRYIWLKEGVMGQPHNLSDTARTWDKVQELGNEISTAIEHDRFEKTPGPLCGWCAVVDCQHNRKHR